MHAYGHAYVCICVLIHPSLVCQAKVVTALIALSQSPEPLVAKTAGQVLQLLADDLPSVDVS